MFIYWTTATWRARIYDMFDDDCQPNKSLFFFIYIFYYFSCSIVVRKKINHEMCTFRTQWMDGWMDFIVCETFTYCCETERSWQKPSWAPLWIIVFEIGGHLSFQFNLKIIHRRTQIKKKLHYSSSKWLWSASRHVGQTFSWLKVDNVCSAYLKEI